MKVLRTTSLVLVIIGIFAWFLAPFISSVGFYSSDGIPASTLVLSSNSDYFSFLESTWKTTALFWMPLVAIALLVLCLLFVLLNQYRWLCACSFAGVIALASGGRLTQTVLSGISEQLLGADLSSGFFLVVGVFAILCGVSIIALCNVKNVWSALSVLFVLVGGAVWLTAPFLLPATFRGDNVISCYSLATANGVEALSFLKGIWQVTSLYWMPLVSAILLGVCLLFILLKDFRWVCGFTSVGIVALIAGGVLTAKLKLRGMYLGAGYYLMIAVFALLLSFAILHLKERKDALEAAKRADDLAKVSE